MTEPASRKGIFLDRDGVLIRAIVRNNRPYAVTRPEEVEFIEGAAEACKELSRLGYKLILTTNQPDVARGKITRQFVDETNALVVGTLGLDEARVCDHDDRHGCECRKPKPGLMSGAAADLALDLAQCIVVGDRWRDVEAGHRAGCKTVFIDYAYDEKSDMAADHTAPSLLAAVDWIRRLSATI